MIKINIYAVGNVKEKYLIEAINEYLKRISRFAKIKVIEVNEVKLQSKSEKDVKEIEGDYLLSKIKDNEYLIILDLNKNELTSEEFASKIDSLISMGKGEISFLIGGSLGLSEKVRKRANFSITFSKLTFPHQLIRLFLVEQIYRAFKIINHESYHH